MKEKHWSKVEYLYETVKNPNIVIKVLRVTTVMLIRRILKIMSCAICTETNILAHILNHCGNMTSFISAIMCVSAPKPLS